MDITEVENIVLQLSKDWYIQKRASFVNHNFYDKNLDKLYDKFIIVDDERNPEEPVEIEHGIDVDIIKYCWFDSSYGTFENPMAYPEDLAVNSYTIAEKIVSLINATINENIDNSSKYKVILHVINTVQTQIEILSNDNKLDEEYIAILDDFSSRFSARVNKKYRQIFNVYALTNEYGTQDQLKFDLNQEELASLMYILYIADMIHCPNINDTRFLHFCQNHFYYKHRTKKTHVKANLIMNKFNDVNSGLNMSLGKVIKKIKETIKDL
jgi:hypothetical protein